MGISGIFKEIGPGQRIALAKVACTHFIDHSRPLRLAIDISIWLFQIQAGKGGSNPALRTFYYRLLRLLTLNIHPLFVFDGPNKPLFKRNKKVGGPGVRVASVPEFLAKQLLKQFGFPWHAAPGEAEAECALLQREGIVDAVLSEDVDTLMFGSGTTLRNWSSEGTSKVPTHVNIYRAAETKEKSGMDREGMILVALMSGGDYITEGIPGCGPKVACDAARAGFGKELVQLAKRRDAAGLKIWREKLQHEIRTNASKLFSRRNTKLAIPDDFPNREVLGYYTDPCVSTAEKLTRLRAELKWDQKIDFPALRSFAADAFDWRCLGGAKKFIRNLAPAMLVRELRLMGQINEQLSTTAQAEREQQYVLAIHGKRNHKTTDAQLEYRISFIPQSLVPIDLSIEDEDDDFVPAGGADDLEEADDEWAQLPSSTQDESDTPTSPTKKRVYKPYFPDQPEKLWLMREFLKVGCPLLVEDFEDLAKDPKEFFKQRRKAQAATKRGADNIHAKKPNARSKKKSDDPAQLPISAFGNVTKSSSQSERIPLKAVDNGGNVRTASASVPAFSKLETSKLPSTQDTRAIQSDDEETPKAKPPSVSLFAAFTTKKVNSPSTPQRRKRRSEETPVSQRSQRTIDTFFSPSPRKADTTELQIINLVSSSPMKPIEPIRRATSPSPRPRAAQELGEYGDLPSSVTKRKKKPPMKRARTAPVTGDDEQDPVAPPRMFTEPAKTMQHTEATQTQTKTKLARHKSAEVRAQVTKTLIVPRKSLAGAWKEVEIESMDLTGDGSGWAQSGGRAELRGYRKSGIEVLDLTGA